MNIDNLFTKFYTNDIKVIFDNDVDVFGFGHFKINLYNGLIDRPMHKYWFKLQNLKIKDKMDNYILIALSESDQDKKFCLYVDLIINSICNKFKKKKVNSNIVHSNHNIIQINTTNFNIFDSKNNKISIDEINKLDLVDVILEINEIKVYNNQMYLIWNILQMKKLPIIDFTTNLFDNYIPPKIIEEKIITPKQPIIKEENKKPIEKTPVFSSAIITPQLLLNQLNKLKKQPETPIVDKDKVETISPINQIKLKKVETKGPLSGFDTFKLMNQENNINVENIINNIDETLDRQYKQKKKTTKRYKSIIKKYKRLNLY